MKIDCIYTLLEPPYFKDVYQKYTKVPRIVYTLPGYIGDDLLEIAGRRARPFQERGIDVGYRARRLPFYMGEGAQEKHKIGVEFRERAGSVGLRMDIETEEQKRIYGSKWYDFLANCRGVLGVEAGVSVFDVQDEARNECERRILEKPNIRFEEVWEQVLKKWEGKIPYRTISPRHFEAAAFRVVQILFEGRYSEIMRPMIHYIPLKKDFSNFDEVIRMFREEALCHELVENGYRDLVASGQYSYRRFIEGFDTEMRELGVDPGKMAGRVQTVDALLNRGKWYRHLRANLLSLRHYSFPGRGVVLFFARPIRRLYRRLRRRINPDSPFVGI
jgi:hypothetical protein